MDARGKYRAVLFDLDNTLIENVEALKKVYKKLKTDLLKREFEDDAFFESAFLEYFGEGHPPIPVCYPRFIEATKLDNAPSVEEMEKFWHDNYPCSATGFPETLDVLCELKSRGYMLGIVTNGPSDFQNPKINSAGLRDIVDVAVVSGDVGVRKPDRRIFDIASDLLGVDNSECLYVGDKPQFDINGAENAGMDSAWRRGYSDEPYNAAYKIDDLNDLLEILKGPLK